MEEYNIYFAGKAPESNISETQLKQNLMQLFKADASKIEKLMQASKAVLIKKQLSKQQAEKYQQVLKHAGARCIVKRIASKTEAPDVNTPKSDATTDQQSSINSALAGLMNYNQAVQPKSQNIDEKPQINDNQSSEGFILLPPNTGSLEEFARQEQFDLPDLSQYRICEPQSLEEFAVRKPAVEIRDISYMDITDMNDRPLSDQSPKPQPIEVPDISHLQMSEPNQGSLEAYSQRKADFPLDKIPDLPLAEQEY